MTAWDNAGLPIDTIDQMSVHRLKEAGSDTQIVDVRSPGEWEKGHIPGAKHIFLPELQEKAHTLDRTRPVVACCNSGYRASLATSLLKREGFSEVSNVPGSFQASKHAGYPVEEEES